MPNTSQLMMMMRMMFYATTTDVLSDEGPVRPKTGGSAVCFFNVLLWMCDNLRAAVG
jgi:hypothetical protein